MIKIGTGLKVSDNSGAKKAICLKIYGCKQTSANIGDLILISVRALRNCRKGLIRVKKGELHKALVIRTKINRQSLNYSTRLTYFHENSIVLLNKHNKLIGSRVIGPILKSIKQTRFLKVASVSFGLV